MDLFFFFSVGSFSHLLADFLKRKPWLGMLYLFAYKFSWSFTVNYLDVFFCGRLFTDFYEMGLFITMFHKWHLGEDFCWGTFSKHQTVANPNGREIWSQNFRWGFFVADFALLKTNSWKPLKISRVPVPKGKVSIIYSSLPSTILDKISGASW